MDIVEFLTARLDEDEAIAKDSQDGPWWIEQRDHARLIGSRADPHMVVLWQEIGIHRSTPDHIARHNPARVLAEVRAKRRVLARHCVTVAKRDYPDLNACDGCGSGGYGYGYGTKDINECPELRDMATAWSDHPDFDPAWGME